MYQNTWTVNKRTSQ